MTATACLWAFAALNLARFAYRRRNWTRGRVCETDAYFARDIGPAVVGLLKPMIVLPNWFHSLPRTHQNAVVLHERAHIAARDPQLVLLAFLVTAAMPWNPILWWQFARLRRAIELDCDERVLRAFDERDYGEALIAVAERRSAAVAPGAIAVAIPVISRKENCSDESAKAKDLDPPGRRTRRGFGVHGVGSSASQSAERRFHPGAGTADANRRQGAGSLHRRLSLLGNHRDVDRSSGRSSARPLHGPNGG